MAPSAGSIHLLVARNLKILRLAAQKVSRFIQPQVSAARTVGELEPIYIRNATCQPVHPTAFLRQSKRWYSSTNGFTSAVRRFTTSPAQGGRIQQNRASFPKSRVSATIALSTGRAPFASQLRPNLTGGALGRTAGGYALGSGRMGGARFFSHTPSAPAQIIQNVNQAIRAFAIGGKKAQYDGVNAKTGEKRYKAVTVLQHEALQKISALPKATPGSFIDFSVNPTITALTPLGAVIGFQASAGKKNETLNTDGLLDILSIDFSRQLKELAVILNDLKRLSALGDLPITYQDSCLRIHFPGCDADSVECLAEELGLQRGVIRQDEDFDAFNGTEIALLFPYAPSKTPSECSFYEKSVTHRKSQQAQLRWDNEAPGAPLSPILGNLPTPDFSTISDSGMGMDGLMDNDSPWLSSPSGYESLHSSELDDSDRCYEKPASRSRDEPLEYQGIEGIYKFISEIDAARR